LEQKEIKRVILSIFMEVNDLIFKELIKRGYSLDGKTRIWNIADSKLWYLAPEQAQAYLNLEQQKEYGSYMFEIEIKLLEKYMSDIANKVLLGSSVNIIDIGCGDGKKAIPVLNVFNDVTKVRYCPIDISSHMVVKAIEKITKLNKGEVVQFKWNISDFDNLENVSSLLRDPEFRQNLFLFLGSTISNFEMHEIMYAIVGAMDSSSDYLLMGVALNNKSPEELVKSYKHKMNDDFLGLVLTQIGFDKKDLEMGVRYKNSRVELYYTILKDKKISLGDRSIFFQKGDQVVVGISTRYKETELKKALKIYFKDIKFYLNNDKTWALILCKK